MDFANSVKDTDGCGLRWYSEFVPKLKKELEAQRHAMAEFLAATSPNTAPLLFSDSLTTRFRCF